jgi:hypothetical protein
MPSPPTRPLLTQSSGGWTSIRVRVKHSAPQILPEVPEIHPEWIFSLRHGALCFNLSIRGVYFLDENLLTCYFFVLHTLLIHAKPIEEPCQ